jgi:hypothetical protein
VNADFATLVFKGSRFDGGVMPLSVLPELAAYQNLVLSAARFLFSLQNPGRQRIDKGFEDKFRLGMKEIQPGSAVPQVVRYFEESQVFMFPESREPDIFDEARDLVEALIGGEEIPGEFLKGQEVSESVRRELFGKFNGFGKTLSKDEYVLVGAPGNRNGVRYDHDKRLRLLLKVNNRYEDLVDLEGILTKVDKDQNQISIRQADGIKIDVRISPLFLGSAIASLTTDQRIRVQGTGIFDETGKLLQVPLVTDLMPEGKAQGRAGCRLTIAEQLAGLEKLPVGWFHPGSPAFQKAEIDSAGMFLEVLVEANGFPVPWLYPTPEGEIRAEWACSDREWILELDAAGRKAFVMMIRLLEEGGAEEEIRLDDPTGPIRLARFLIQHGLSGD